VRFSNTRRFFEKGWSGLCIEAASQNHAALEVLYRGTSVATEHAAVTDHSGTATFHAVSNRADDGGLSGAGSLIAGRTNRWPGYRWHTEDVPADTLDNILARHNLDDFDLLTIDVEGAEVEVLDGFSFRQRPMLLIIESNDPEGIIQRVIPHGYRVWLDTGQDLFLTHVADWRWMMLRVLGTLLGSRPFRRLLRMVSRATPRGG
jgi:FkbM family methyltransferase